MPEPIVTRATVFEDGGAANMARVAGSDGANITQASISSIACKVYDLYDNSEVTPAPTVTVATSVFDTLQTDARWTVDSTGYNFRHVIGASTLSDPDKTYRIEYEFTPGSGEHFWCVYELTTIGVLSN